MSRIEYVLLVAITVVLVLLALDAVLPAVQDQFNQLTEVIRNATTPK